MRVVRNTTELTSRKASIRSNSIPTIVPPFIHSKTEESTHDSWKRKRFMEEKIEFSPCFSRTFDFAFFFLLIEVSNSHENIKTEWTICYGGSHAVWRSKPVWFLKFNLTYIKFDYCLFVFNRFCSVKFSFPLRL